MSTRSSLYLLFALFFLPRIPLSLAFSTVARIGRHSLSIEQRHAAVSSSSRPNSKHPALIRRAAAAAAAAAGEESVLESDDPTLQTIFHNLHVLSHQGSDIRGTFVDHAGSSTELAAIAKSIQQSSKGVPPLTPLAAYCFGYALVEQRLEQEADSKKERLTIAVGNDPRLHGTALAGALVRGALQAGKKLAKVPVHVKYAGLATTPACAAFCRMELADAAVMITASHLPGDRNGLKFFAGTDGAGYDKPLLHDLGAKAQKCFESVYKEKAEVIFVDEERSIPCETVFDWMPKKYAESLKDAIRSKVVVSSSESSSSPLEGLTIVLNAGNGAGGFFAQALADLGAKTMKESLYLDPDGTFPHGVPNPELSRMVDETIKQCQAVNADIGILLDTDADRCGFVVPSGKGNSFQPLNRNRLIALLSVIFAREAPGCAIVTDSVTSEGLSAFLTDNLGLKHVRYLKGYANVINKSKELTESGKADARMGIETSGHCAMQENGYLDDGTYTAVQVVSLLANERAKSENKGNVNLLDLIADMKELPVVDELRMTTSDGSLDTMQRIFDVCSNAIDKKSSTSTDENVWTVDTENLEGIRVRFGGMSSGQFFMLRKSLHDPVISLQIEAQDQETARSSVVQPLLALFRDANALDELEAHALLEY